VALATVCTLVDVCSDAAATTAPAPAPTGSTGIAAGTPKDHTIQRGETFSSIALAAYGDPKYWKEIKKANPTVDDTKLKPGTVVKLPEAASVKAAHAPVAGNQPGNATGGAGSTKVEAPIDPSRDYRVQPSDSLHKIALKLYGKASKADSIYELNREKIGGDSARIKVGMVLKLPEARKIVSAASSQEWTLSTSGERDSGSTMDLRTSAPSSVSSAGMSLTTRTAVLACREASGPASRASTRADSLPSMRASTSRTSRSVAAWGTSRVAASTQAATATRHRMTMRAAGIRSVPPGWPPS